MRTKTYAAAILIAIMAVIVLVSTFTFAYAEEISSDAASMEVIESTTGRVLYSRNSHERRPMASTTKICTAITVIEHTDDLNKVVDVPSVAVGVEGSSIYLARDEKVKIIDLLYGLMLQSGNDCAVALAVTVGGSIENFAALMNETAAKAGAENSHFVNPHGLHDDDHYTTAHDLALITAYAFKNEVFEKIVSTKSHVMHSEGREYPRTIVNKNKILSTYEGGDGVKTGYTKKAGRCLVSSASRGGMRVIAVTLNCGPMFEECSRLMDKACGEYSLYKLADPQSSECEIGVIDGMHESTSVSINSDIYYPLKKEETEKIVYRTNLPERVNAPLKKGEEVGTLEISLENQLLFSEKFYIMVDEPKPDLWDRIQDFAREW